MRFLAVTWVALACAALQAEQSAAQSTPLFSLGAGAGLSTGATSERHGNGFQLGAAGAFPLSGRVELEVGAVYGRMGAKTGPVLEDLDIDPETFALAGGFLDGGHRWIGAVTAGARILLLPRSSRFVPSISAGAGWGGSGVADQQVWYLGRPESIDGFTENSWSSSFGAHVDVALRDGIGLFGGVRQVTVYTDPEPVRWIPITLGISLRLEQR